ncbi:MAG TPA: DUF2142 domain-containing protein [Opitutaceae bacterium]|nr:DUF2142 domain-containing protein [Opitutaceae bacterium]
MSSPPRPAGGRRSGWERLQPPAVFLSLGLVFGLAVLAANPPFQSADEYEHFFRAYQVSAGKMTGERRGDTAGGWIPAYLNAVGVTEGIPFHPERKMTAVIFRRKLNPLWVRWGTTPDSSPVGFVSFPHTALYAPSGYIPQALALVLGRLCRVGPLGLMYLARLAGFSASLALGWAALKAAPFLRWSLMLALLCPTSLYLMGSVAPDGIIITSAFLLAALVARLAANGSGPDFKPALAIALLGGLLGTAKFVYLPFAAAAFLILWPCFPAGRRRAAWAAICLFCAVFPTLIWCHVVSGLYVPARPDIPIDPRVQLQGVEHAPLAFLALVAKTIRSDWAANYRSVVATMGWADTFAPAWFYPAYGLGLLGCLALEVRGAGPLRSWQRWTLVAAAVVVTGLIYLAEYLIWNAPGSRETIQGIAGRYLLPLVPFALLAVPPLGRFAPAGPRAAFWGTALGTLSAAVCLWSVLARYYFG